MDSLFERIGGEPAIDAAVDIFYKKVLADDRIKGFFSGIDMEKQIQKQKSFLTFAFGGPSPYQVVACEPLTKALSIKVSTIPILMLFWKTSGNAKGTWFLKN